MSAEPIHHFAPAPRLVPRAEADVVHLDRAPRNHTEMNALLASRMADEQAKRTAADAATTVLTTPAAPPSLIPAGPAMSLAALQEAQEARRLAEVPPAPPPAPKPFLPPQTEAEARSRLAEAIRVRDEAHQILTHVADAVAKARCIEAEAEARAAAGATTEMRGADDLARRILEWSVAGGERPDLAPDAASLDARREQDLARVHADAAHQAVRALEVDLTARRGVAEQADRAVTQAASEVVAVMIEDVAIRGVEAQRIYERARLASRVVFDLGATAGLGRTIRAQPVMRQLGHGGEITCPIPETPESGSRSQHHAEWEGLLKALQTNANATVG